MFSKPSSKYKVSSRQPVKANAPSGNPGPTVTSLPVDAAPSPEGETTEAKHLQLWPLESREMVKMFLKDIHGRFVNSYDMESGLHDKLTECGVIMDSDNQSLIYGTHLPTPKDKARHLWKILSKINHEIFVRDVLPPLCERYYHIIPPKYWKTSETGRSGPPVCTDPPAGQCARCDIQGRVRECDMADFLLDIGLMKHEAYDELTRNHRLQKPNWQRIFAAFQGQGPAAGRHEADMTSLLERHSLSVPSDLPDLMSQGFPCRCQQEQQQQQAARRDGVTGAQPLAHANYLNSLREIRLGLHGYLPRSETRRGSNVSAMSDTSSLSEFNLSDASSDVTSDLASLSRLSVDSDYLQVYNASVRSLDTSTFEKSKRQKAKFDSLRFHRRSPCHSDAVDFTHFTGQLDPTSSQKDTDGEQSLVDAILSDLERTLSHEQDLDKTLSQEQDLELTQEVLRSEGGNCGCSCKIQERKDNTCGDFQGKNDEESTTENTEKLQQVAAASQNLCSKVSLRHGQTFPKRAARHTRPTIRTSDIASSVITKPKSPGFKTSDQNQSPINSALSEISPQETERERETGREEEERQRKTQRKTEKHKEEREQQKDREQEEERKPPQPQESWKPSSEEEEEEETGEKYQETESGTEPSTLRCDSPSPDYPPTSAEAVEDAAVSYDLRDFWNYVNRAAIDGGQLSELFHQKAASMNPEPREGVRQLLEQYYTLEERFRHFRMMHQQHNDVIHQEASSSQDNDDEFSCPDASQSSREILTLWGEILALRRISILCELYINTANSSTTEETLNRAHALACDVMNHLHAKYVEVQRLEEITETVGRGLPKTT